MFLNLKTLRDSCYRCPYAGRFRAGDLTVGDFWGVEANRPDVLKDAEKFNQMKGVSCLLVNNDRGRKFVEVSNALDLYPVEFNDIAKGNDQLRQPSVLPEDRRLYIDAFANGGWDAVERLYKKRERGIVFYAKRALRAILPKPAIRAFKKALSK